MKNVLSLFLVLFSIVTVSAQDGPDMRGFVFPEFIDGSIVMTNGEWNNAPVNYDALYQKMLFKSLEGNYYSIGNIESVLMVIVDGRVFVPFKGAIFYEEIPLADSRRLYIQHKSEYINKSSVAGRNKTSAATDIKSLTFNGDVTARGPSYHRHNANTATYKMGDNHLEEVNMSLYHIKVDGKFKPVLSAKSLWKVFGHKDEIVDFVRSNKSDFAKLSDVIDVVTYCYGL